MRNLHKLASLSLLLAGGFSVQAQVKVGNNTNTINTNAVFEIESINRGMLLPRVSLTGTSNVAPLSAHVLGMAVYNSATVGDVTPGFYYNDGTRWLRLAASGTGGQIVFPGTALTSASAPAGIATGQVLYNTNAAAGLPAGPAFWTGTAWLSMNDGNTIYTADGTLTGNRIVTTGANTLTFNGSVPVSINNTTGTTNTIAASVPVATISRTGISGQSSNQRVDLEIGKYAAGVNANTQLNIKMTNGAVSTTDVTVMTVQGNGNVGIGTTTPTSKLAVVGLPVYADNTAATTGGLAIGDFYRTATGVVMVRF
ncbi:hypothetical protein [Spirosoma utsteinense]|uniref:Uncharacterized protein n=1 Tax=Spirosoma utsteinense TaxID=2585773 RepID=A0ABR6WD49_9BACT|nr:hypothetical protein [Spirosoma utsteinense]MBC3788414.1 hypothetical protein [Spirosoma utsteinense]MBC3794495.1 hypothetical protein [Spirosoma utsteinense]